MPLTRDRLHSVILFGLYLCFLPTFLCRGQSEFEVPKTDGFHWFRGNTHTHTILSDGDSPPEVVAQWYKAHGYQFLVLTDHDKLTDPKYYQDIVDSHFILVPGEEVTGSFRGAPVHVNGLGIQRVVEPLTDSTLVGTIQKNIDAVRGAGGVPQINHPNYEWALSENDLLQVKNENLFEIFNGHPDVNNFGGGGRPGMEEVWDFLLTKGKRIYGIASDDSHHLLGEFGRDRCNPGRGWVVVKAKDLDAGEIVQSLDRGLFYSSTGVELEDVLISARRIEIRIRQEKDRKYKTEFIGSNGNILAQTGENPAVFLLGGEGRYVRARVRDSKGSMAWIQPIFIRNSK